VDDKKKVGLIVTIVTVLLCGFPGLCVIVSGAIFSFGSGADSFSTNVDSPLAVGIPLLCIGLLMLLSPLGAGIYTILQSRKAEELEDIEVPEAL
jgi:hypothetical protein